MATNRPFRFGIVTAQARSGEEWLAKARRVESLGFSTLLMPDTLGYTLSPLPALTAIAAATATLRLGSYVLVNDFRNPVLLARECATLDWLSNGRLELGLGVGRPGAEEDYRKLGQPFGSAGARIERLSAALPIIKTLLSGQKADTSEPHYPIAGADIFPRPVQQPRPPIMIAAGGKRMLSLAAREADIIALALPPDAPLATVSETIELIRAAAGERFDQIELNGNLFAVGQHVPEWVRARMKLDVAALAQAGSIAVLVGTTDEMCNQLLERRERFGISYITAGEDTLEALAPVVERLAGR